MPFDFKKEYKEFYLPPKKPQIVDIPPMNYIAVRGQGDPNEEGGAYQQAMGVLYAVAYTLNLRFMGGRRFRVFFKYVVPPLVGFWQQEGGGGIDCAGKSGFRWTSVIRLPDFITPEDFRWAVEEASEKKKLDCSAAEFLPLTEGLCVQMMHIGSYDAEPASIALMDEFLAANGWENDLTAARLHHEIYLSDPRRTAPEKRKTVLRHPIKKQESPRPAGQGEQ